MKSLHRAAGAALAIGGIWGLVWASNAPMTAYRSSDGIVRLAWSARPERIETCRERTADELAGLPQHMRLHIVCEGSAAQYRLVLRVDGVTRVDRIVRGGGLRQDRRVYVFHDVPAGPGDVSIGVRFDRVEPDPPPRTGMNSGPPGASTVVPGPRSGETIPAHLSLEQRLTIPPRSVVLITYSAERRSLALKVR